VYFTFYSKLALTVVSAIKLFGVSFVNQTIITKQGNHTNKIHNINISIVLRWTASIPWIPTKINYYSSHNHKQFKSSRNNCSSLFVCLFSGRYNPLWLYFHSPVAGFSLLVLRGFLITLYHTCQHYLTNGTTYWTLKVCSDFIYNFCLKYFSF
jgi:hypothetical protein